MKNSFFLMQKKPYQQPYEFDEWLNYLHKNQTGCEVKYYSHLKWEECNLSKSLSNTKLKKVIS